MEFEGLNSIKNLIISADEVNNGIDKTVSVLCVV